MKNTIKISTLLVAIFFAFNMYALENLNLMSSQPKATTTTKKSTTSKTTQPTKQSTTKTVKTKEGTLTITSEKDKTTITRTGNSQPTKTKSKKPTNESAVKAFEGKGSKTVSLGIGANNAFTFFPKNGKGIKGWSSPIYGALNIQAEFGVHKYVGVGLTVGFGATGNLDGLFHSSIYSGAGTFANNWGISIPVGVIANFHFYQLIEDKTRKSIHGDKLDLYAGANLGAGPAFSFPRKKNNPNGKNDFGYIIFGGLQIGARYYVKPKLAVFAEVGFGKSIINAGVSFKM